MPIKKSVPIALVPNQKQGEAHSDTQSQAKTSRPSRPKGAPAHQISNPRVDEALQNQITHLINTIVTPKIKQSPFKALLLPLNQFQPDSLEQIRKHVLVPKKAQDLFLGYAQDGEVLILSSFEPSKINVFDSIANNPETMPNYLTLSMQFDEFRGKLDLVLEALKIAASVQIDDSYQQRMSDLLEIGATDITFSWKRMEDLKRYGSELVNGEFREKLLTELDSRLANQDITPEEISIIWQTMEESFEALKSEIEARYSNMHQVDELSFTNQFQEFSSTYWREAQQQKLQQHHQEEVSSQPQPHSPSPQSQPNQHHHTEEQAAKDYYNSGIIR
jgi:hypothetical protein